MTTGDPTRATSPPAPLAADAWRRVLVVMEKLAASSDLDEILSIVIDAMRDCLEADRASVFQYDGVRGELIAARAHGVDATLRIPVTRGLAGEAVRTRRIINVPDCRTDDRFNPEVDLRTGYTTRSMLTVPLVSFDGVVEGVAQVLNKGGAAGPGGGPFCAQDEELARGLASQAAVAIRRARLIEAERRKTKIEADLRIARDIQFAALPQELPVVAGYDLAARTIPAEETGGDLFDIVPVAGGSGSRLVLLVADAAGHGIGPALAVTKLQAMLRLSVNLGSPLERALECINRQLCETLPVGRYVASVIAELDPAAHQLRTLTAGLSSAFMVDASGGVTDRNSDALALAIDPEWTASGAVETVIPPGGALVVLTDGYTEARSPTGSMLGLDGVRDILGEAVVAAAREPRPALAVLERLETMLSTHADGCPAADDRTALVVYRSTSRSSSQNQGVVA